MGRRHRQAPSLCRMANCAAAPSTMVCSAAASPAAPTTGSCAPISSCRQFPRGLPDSSDPAGAPIPARPAAAPAAARHLSDHRAGACDLWGGAAAGAPIGARDPRHAQRSGRRHLRPEVAAMRLAESSSWIPDQKRGPDQEARRLRLARSFRPRSGAASSVKRSTTIIKPSPIPAPAAILAASRAGSIFCAGR